MTTSEELSDPHSPRNDELLTRLHAARNAAGGFGPRRHLLDDPEVHRLVYQLVEENQPWIAACVRRAKRQLNLRDSPEELLSQALTGQGGAGADVRGVLGAILHYDHERFGARAFTRYLAQSIHNALVPRRGAERATLSLSFPLPPPNGRAATWADRRQRQPREQAIDAELLAVLETAVEHLPPRNRDVARYILGYLCDHGERPTAREVGASRNPPVTKQAGEALMKQTMDRLAEKVEELYPQLAQDGVGGWQRFSAVFGIHKHHGSQWDR